MSRETTATAAGPAPRPVRTAPLLLLALVLAAAPAQAFRRAGTAAAQFLKFDVDARSSALAGASVALPGGWEAGWNGAGGALGNPASPAGAIERGLAAGQRRLVADLRSGSLLGVLPLGGRLALHGGFTWLTAPDQEITTLEQPDGAGRDYSYGDLSLNLGAALRLSDRLSVGATGRWLRQTLHNERAEGAAVDLGLLLDTGWRDLHLGLAMVNFGPRLRLEGEDLLLAAEDGRPARLDTQEFQLPLTFRVGLRDRLWEAGGQRLHGSLQAEHPNDNRENLRLGLEYELRGRLWLRAGRALRRDVETWSAGFGLRLPAPQGGGGWRLDYAWNDWGLLGDVHQFSLGFDF